MTPHQVDLVQSSFAKVAPIADAAAAMFYGRLFEIAPEVKPLFHGDMAEQRRKLMTTLGVVVNGLKNLDAVLPAARTLAVIWRSLWRDDRRGLWRTGRGVTDARPARDAPLRAPSFVMPMR